MGQRPYVNTTVVLKSSAGRIILFVRYEVADESNKTLLLKKVTKRSGTKVGVLSMGKSVSFCKGKGSMAHNNREFITSNVDQSRTPLNIIYKQEPIAEAYEKLFGE